MLQGVLDVGDTASGVVESRQVCRAIAWAAASRPPAEWQAAMHLASCAIAVILSYALSILRTLQPVPPVPTSSAIATEIDRVALRSAIGGVLFGGLSPLLVRLSPVDPAATALWRLVLALPATLWLARSELPIPVQARLWAMFSGFLLAADLLLWNRAILMTTILEANVLVMLYPLLVAVGGWIVWGERISGRVGIGGLIAFFGIVAMTVGSATGASSIAGNLLAIGAAIFYAGSMLVTARLCKSHSAIMVTVWIFVGAILTALPVALIEDRFLATDAIGWGTLLVYGAVTFSGYLLTNRSLGRLPASLVAVLGYGQPVIAALAAIPLFNEVPTLGDALGAAIVATGLVVSTSRAPD
jgi:drug/metabolite transporter (DMT)-like permease